MSLAALSKSVLIAAYEKRFARAFANFYYEF